jgi:hypothetical protein
MSNLASYASRTPRDITDRIRGTVPLSAEAGWLPGTSVAWLEVLRQRHEAAVERLNNEIAAIPASLAAVDELARAHAEASHAYALRRGEALRYGTPIPIGPAAPDTAGALANVWAPLSRAVQAVEGVVREVARDVVLRADELDRSHVAHARHNAVTGTATPEQIAVQALVDNASFSLGFELQHYRDLVAGWRVALDPPTARDATTTALAA